MLSECYSKAKPKEDMCKIFTFRFIGDRCEEIITADKANLQCNMTYDCPNNKSKTEISGYLAVLLDGYKFITRDFEVTLDDVKSVILSRINHDIYMKHKEIDDLHRKQEMLMKIK